MSDGRLYICPKAELCCINYCYHGKPHIKWEKLPGAKREVFSGDSTCGSYVSSDNNRYCPECELSGASIGLLSLKGSGRVWGFIVGLMGQPLWIYTTYVEGQWGIFILSIWFIFAHINGIINHLNTKGRVWD